MAVRVTAAEVMAILDVQGAGIGFKTDLSPFIQTANVLVNTTCLASDYTDELLKLIELWLSAHFVKIKFPVVISERILRSETRYAVVTAMGLNSTPYGQQAMLLDVKGNLADISRLNDPSKLVRRRGVYWAGTEAREDNGCCVSEE